MTTPSGTSSEETEQSIRSLDPVPTALLRLILCDGYYDLITCDLGTEFTSEDTKKLPTLASHIPGNPDVSTAKYRYRVDPIGDGQNVVIIDRMKEGLYSGPEAKEQRKDLAAIERRIPYLKDRYTNTGMNDHPEIWLLADYILWLINLVIPDGTNDTGKPPIWIFIIPSNWSKKSIKLYTIALNASPKLKDRYILQSEIASVLTGLINLSLEGLEMENGTVFCTFDFSISRQISKKPVQFERIMPPTALYGGGSDVENSFEKYIRDLWPVKSELPEKFERNLGIAKISFATWFKSWDGEEELKTYSFGDRDITVTSKFFFLGGASNSSILQKGIEEFLHVTGLQDLDIVALGTCNCTMIVSYRAILQALIPTNSFTKSYYWIGICKEELYRKCIHISPLDEDDIPAKRNNTGESKYNQAKTIQ
ncbi:hypothetical protein BPAE_0177g00300 [Botrytis paeoniae]|uniref:Uncharacterized protein n=1 Tax=Botrytis paeoniae TaxID=278948 RepID=A0A4Z1FCJ6_9HELO|nr:hypothetical protein BPAE_0177g00300 [Botrytis paeoniae]